MGGIYTDDVGKEGIKGKRLRERVEGVDGKGMDTGAEEG